MDKNLAKKPPMEGSVVSGLAFDGRRWVGWFCVIDGDSRSILATEGKLFMTMTSLERCSPCVRGLCYYYTYVGKKNWHFPYKSFYILDKKSCAERQSFRAYRSPSIKNMHALCTFLFHKSIVKNILENNPYEQSSIYDFVYTKLEECVNKTRRFNYLTRQLQCVRRTFLSTK